MIVHTSLEKHWVKTDQDVFICPIVLNPFLQASGFAGGVLELTPLGLSLIIKCIFKCVFHHESDLPFHLAFLIISHLFMNIHVRECNLISSKSHIKIL
ncbi:hypothetical protein PAXRUDRAFT_156129 [Paxillus rubicundulus Ve08.2h10]|uniref:Uncharacterized protein n=1 Tax=Paxillus rubicundulus Ve08.2h10 TaxID=930991 RepID=A0A0D0D0G0_9AGAM|nr:hypothetical protein PAXRUDRAFT_156129 [Paxillus rubicundulus Ve08.2h10]